MKRILVISLVLLAGQLAAEPTNSAAKTNVVAQPPKSPADPVAVVDAQIERLLLAQEATWKEWHELNARIAAARRMSANVSKAEAHWAALQNRAHKQNDMLAPLYLKRAALDPLTSVAALEKEHSARIHKAIVGTVPNPKSK